MSLDEAFKVTFDHIDWARQAANDMESEWLDFRNSTHARTVSEVDPNTGRYLHKIRLSDAIPFSILARKATEGIGRIRDAFDNALFKACVTIGKPPTGKINFPWASSLVDFERNRLKSTDKKGNRKIPEEFWDVIRRQEPYFTGDTYTGGDNHIRELAEISNQRHSVGITTQGRVWGTYIHMIAVERGGIQYRSQPAWDPVNNEVIFAETESPAYVNPNCNVALEIVFDVSSDLRDVPANIAIKRFADKAEAFTKAIRRQCKRELYFKPNA